MDELLIAIVDDDAATVKALLRRERDLATRRINQPRLYDSGILHWTLAKAEILKAEIWPKPRQG
jgi:hypothetical protein